MKNTIIYIFHRSSIIYHLQSMATGSEPITEYQTKVQQLAEMAQYWGKCRNIVVIPDCSPADYRSKIYFEFCWGVGEGVSEGKLSNESQLLEQMRIVKAEMAQLLLLTANFPHLFPSRREFSKVGLWVKLNQLGEMMLKWVFFYEPVRISPSQHHIHDMVNDWLCAWKDYYSFHVADTIVSIYYQLENMAERGKVETKKKHYYHWKGVRQLREPIADFVYYISPDRFTQVNWYTQPTFYQILLREIQFSSQLFPMFPLSHLNQIPNPYWNIGFYPDDGQCRLIRPMRHRTLFCFGRDIGAITLLYAPYFASIRGFTYCPIVHKDCEQNWQEYARNAGEDVSKAVYHYAPRAKLYKSFMRPARYPDSENNTYVLVWSSGRHGLRTDELKWLVDFAARQQVESMVYISCNLKTLQRDISWIRVNLPDARLRKIYTLNQFPGTDYLETHVWWDFY